MREVGLQRLPGSANFQQGAVQTAGRRKTTTPHGVNDHRGTMAHAAKKQKQEDFQPRLRYGESCAPALRCDLLVLCGGRRTRVTTTPSSYRLLATARSGATSVLRWVSRGSRQRSHRVNQSAA